MSKLRAFTFWEILAVLVIAFVIAVVLYPVFAPRRRNGRFITCISNEKQIGLAMAQYVQDYDNRLPPRQFADDGGHRSTWRTALTPYSKSTAIFRCPSNPAAYWVDFENDGVGRSYAVNTSGGGAGGVGGPFSDRHPSLKIEYITNPADLITMAESTAAFDDFNPLFQGAFAQPSGQNRMAGHLFCHHEFTNVLYADGHVKAMHPSNMLRRATGVNPWTIDGSPFSRADLATAKSTLAYGLSQSKVDGN